MAVKAATISRITSFGDECHVVTWAALANTDTGAPIEMPGSSDRSIQFEGTFGAGGTVILEGSNDGTNYHPLTDPQGNDISKTAADLEMITELTRWVRPRVSAGDGTTAIVPTLFLKKVR